MQPTRASCNAFDGTGESGLKGNKAKGIAPGTWYVAEDYDPSDIEAARKTVNSPGVPLGIIYRDETRATLTQKIEEARTVAKPSTAAELIDSLII